MNLSYWEITSWLKDPDFCVVGGGITGISCALELRHLYPEARILVLERGNLPQGASTKNAGFACFGSLTEILDDLQTHSEEEVTTLVASRYRGIAALRKRIGDADLGYFNFGGYEVFPEASSEILDRVLGQRERINALLHPVFGRDAFELRDNSFGLKGILPQLLCNPMEGQLDPAKMMRALYRKAAAVNIPVLHGVTVNDYQEQPGGVTISAGDYEIRASRLLIATNGFAAALTNEQVQPARAQVLVTQPIPGLRLKGSFHLEAGYYYFRNVGDRVLLGGGRNLDKAGETTTEFGLTQLIQGRLEELLCNTIVPDHPVEISHRWSGIMGVGAQKKPIVKRLSDRVFCGVRLGGMGVAIGSDVGTRLARLARG